MPGRSKIALLATAAALAALGGAGVTARAADPVDARLEGEYRMVGTITRAEHVRGEREGDTVKRNWEFTSECELGPCDSVVLRRHRGAKRVDRLTLERTDTGEYSGKGRFYFPIRCAGRVHRKGGEARFRIDVTIDSATVTGVADAIRAKYTNGRRINHTQCTHGSLGRDAASYEGTLQDG